MIDDCSTKRAVVYLLSRGQATQAEAAKLSGRSRQIVRHWARDLPDTRATLLKAQWVKAQKYATSDPPRD